MRGKFTIAPGFVLLAAVFTLMVPYGFSYAGVSYENPAPGTVRSPNLQGSGIPMSDYSIGFRDSSGKTPCKVEDVRAQNSEQALALAQAECPTCQVRDLTGEQVTAEAPWDTTPMSVAFCQMDLPTNPAGQ